MTDEQLARVVSQVIAKDVLPLFNELIVANHKTQEELADFKAEMFDFKDQQLSFTAEMRDFKDQQLAFNVEMRDFKDRQLSFNDWVAKKLETLEIEYLAIRNQIEEYDSFFSDPNIPEEKKKSAYKVMVLKVESLDKELRKIKQILNIA